MSCKKCSQKVIGFEAPADQPRTPSGCAPSGGHVGRRQAAQAGSTVSYDVLGLSNMLRSSCMYRRARALGFKCNVRLGLHLSRKLGADQAW